MLFATFNLKLFYTLHYERTNTDHMKWVFSEFVWDRSIDVEMKVRKYFCLIKL